ncbi:hypothetical protein BDP81DRAFT_416160 [Colletotrichum phormii]|uniref:Secreted protein n=1 Tax=Colletotrichum phormii TaxID=359342 RepID=A0AAJ0A1A4_9PEZI|nr:uncharacterized protein BDP81DRAFT_416160 [Colletotrichum phormii]KAK1654628.1 hypothetical protein BDP81DRAFT_416160 [Colletotrichum phormii]
MTIHSSITFPLGLLMLVRLAFLVPSRTSNSTRVSRACLPSIKTPLSARGLTRRLSQTTDRPTTSAMFLTLEA